MPDGFPGFGQPRPVRFRPCAGGFCGSLREQGGRGRDRIQELAANHALDVVRRYLTGLPIG